MEKRDARTLKIEAQQELRYQVVRMRRRGIKNPDIALTTQLSIESVSRIWSIYKKGGMKAIKIQKRGRKEGMKKDLSPEQEATLIKHLIDTTPKQLKFKFVLWTREAVQQLIKHKFDIEMPISTVGLYLQRWEFSSQVPIKRAYERNDTKVTAWLEEEYPKIQKQAQEEEAEIQWGDETACVSLPSIIKGYAPKGKTPVMKHTAKKFKINMISTITNRGKLRFMVFSF